MARHIHFHFYTGDTSGWKESDHPRGENGQFGSGTASEPAKGSVSVKGDELGSVGSMKELRKAALMHAERFIGKTFNNKATGNAIAVTRSGVKHTLAGASDTLIRTIPAIPSLLETAKLVATAPDKRGDVNVLLVETYEAQMRIDGTAHRAIVTVKKYSDGRRYYDHGIIK